MSDAINPINIGVLRILLKHLTFQTLIIWKSVDMPVEIA